jgi:hypothetical protein
MLAVLGLVFVGPDVSPTLDRGYPLGLNGSDSLNAPDAWTGQLYWSTSGTVDCAPVPSF